MASADLPQDLNRLQYDPDTGEIFWISGIRKGKIAGHKCKDGYKRITLPDRSYAAHRIAWMIHFGVSPSITLDHINGVRDDNRISNLRECTPLEQSRNRALPCHNTSGFHGVTWNKNCGKWQAGISVKRRHIHLGLFINIEDAKIARQKAEAFYGFHANNGRKKS